MKTVAELKALRKSSATMEEFLKSLTKLYFSGDMKDAEDGRLVRLAQNVLERKDDLRSAALSIQKTVTGVLERLDCRDLSYAGISSSGELQSSGPRFDIACARYYDAFEQFNAELVGRYHIEEKAAREKVLKDLTGAPYLIVEQLRRDGDTTAAKLVRDITKGTDFDETIVRTALSLLAQYGIVHQVGSKHYRFVPDFPVDLEAEVKS